MKAVILAGGLGVRLRPFTEVIPKPLLPVGEKAILEIQIERFRSFGFKEIFLAILRYFSSLSFAKYLLDLSYFFSNSLLIVFNAPEIPAFDNFWRN